MSLAEAFTMQTNYDLWPTKQSDRYKEIQKLKKLGCLKTVSDFDEFRFSVHEIQNTTVDLLLFATLSQ